MLAIDFVAVVVAWRQPLPGPVADSGGMSGMATYPILLFWLFPQKYVQILSETILDGICVDMYRTVLTDQTKSKSVKVATTLQSMMNAKLIKQRFWHCYENGLIKMIQTIPHNL